MSETTTAADAPPAPAGPPARVGRNELGRIDVGARAVEKIAAIAAVEILDAGGVAGSLLARAVPGAAFGWRRGGMDRLPKVSADVDGSLVFLDVELSVRWPAPIAQVTEAVRQHLFRQVGKYAGLDVREVNIEVVELVTEPATTRVA